MPDHLGLTATNAKFAIITGNPERVPIISEYFDANRKMSDKRGFLCYEAVHNSISLLVVATGIGAPSTAIVVEELIDLGVTSIIRLGTCGALQTHIKVGDLVIPVGCVREEGTTLQYIDSIFPAVPDYVMLHELIANAARQNLSCHIGITHCKDAYYLESPGKQLLPERTRQQWERWRLAGVLATEMETSALFVLGSLRRIRTSAIFISVGKVTDPLVFKHSLDYAVEIIKQTITSLVEKSLVIARDASPDNNSSFLDKTLQ